MGFFNKEKLKQANSTENKQKKYTLLLVDDEEANLRSLKQMLENEYNILTASDGFEALEIIKQHPVPEKIQLIISDQRMPKKTGVEFLKETIDTIPRSIRIILTGFTDIDAIIGAINDGQVYKFLAKPIEPKDLKVTIKRSLEAFELKIKNDKLIKELKELNQSLEKKVEERTRELLEINELQRGLVETIVHDLKNPLSNILMFSSFIGKRANDMEKARETALLINNSAKNMASMVENLLEVDKIEQGGILPSWEIIDLIPVIKSAVNDFSEKVSSKNLQLTFNHEQANAIVKLDESMIKRIIDNLLSNAIKFSPFDKTVEINLKKEGNNYLISVKDQGQGLTDEDKSKLFKKFARLSAQPTDGEHSTGLGLSIVKRLCESMDGKIYCESEYGNGANFILSFKEFEESINK